MRSDVLAAHVAELEREYRIVRLPWIDNAGGAYSIASLRQICGPPVTDDKTYFTNVHEICHCINGDCTQAWPHERVDAGCLYCEFKASEGAWKIITDRGYGSGEVFDRLQYALGTYRRSSLVPQSQPAAVAADRLRNFCETYAKPLQNKVDLEWRRELVATWQQDVHRQPNSLATCRARLAQALK